MSDTKDAYEPLRRVLDAAHREWVEAGHPAGEAVVHLNEFVKLGLWKPPTKDDYSE